MKKSLFVALICAALVGAFILPNLFAADVPGEIMLKAPDGVKMKKGPVPFMHKGSHEAYQCTECHHTWDGKGEPKKCTECHAAKAHKIDGKKVLDFKKAFHKQCWTGCHKKVNKEGKKAPVKCNQCHTKKK